jgi:hypothetical protein
LSTFSFFFLLLFFSGEPHRSSLTVISHIMHLMPALPYHHHNWMEGFEILHREGHFATHRKKQKLLSTKAVLAPPGQEAGSGLTNRVGHETIVTLQLLRTRLAEHFPGERVMAVRMHLYCTS